MSVIHLKKEIGKRLELVRDKLNLTNLSLSTSIGVDNSSIGKIIKGTLSLSNESLVEINSKYGVSIEWLLTGKGEMFLSENELSRLQQNEEEKRKGDTGCMEVLKMQTEIIKSQQETIAHLTGMPANKRQISA